MTLPVGIRVASASLTRWSVLVTAGAVVLLTNPVYRHLRRDRFVVVV